MAGRHRRVCLTCTHVREAAGEIRERERERRERQLAEGGSDVNYTEARRGAKPLPTYVRSNTGRNFGPASTTLRGIIPRRRFSRALRVTFCAARHRSPRRRNCEILLRPSSGANIRAVSTAPGKRGIVFKCFASPEIFVVARVSIAASSEFISLSFVRVDFSCHVSRKRSRCCGAVQA